MALLEPPIGELGLIRDLVAPGPGGEIPLRLFDARANRDPGPAVVFFHGGGFVIGNIDTHASMCGEIARRLDLPVISVDYRLAPENPWPAAVDDAETAARWVAENGAKFNRAITSLVLCGDSAGGTLTLVTALALRDRPAAAPVILQVPIYPASDICGDYPSGEAFADGYGLSSAEIHWYREVYRPDPRHWRAAPLHADLTGAPPMLMLTASLDPLRDQGRAYAGKAVQAGVSTVYREAVGAIHGFAGYRRVIPSAQEDFAAALTIARAMIDEATAKTTAPAG
jgi:acetyl esterase